MSWKGNAVTAFFGRIASAPAVRMVRDGIAGSRVFLFLARIRERWRRFAASRKRLANWLTIFAMYLVLTGMATFMWRREQVKFFHPKILEACAHLDEIKGKTGLG